MNALLLHCRAGFEAECAAEIQQHSATLGIAGYCQTQRGRAYVLFHAYEPGGAHRLHCDLAFSDLVFARQWFVVHGAVAAMPVSDRVTPIVEALAQHGLRAAKVVVEAPDSDHTKPLSPLCRSLTPLLTRALRERDLLDGHDEGDGRNFHVCFTVTDAALVGDAQQANCAPWPMGIPRLRSPPRAPSRSTLKLEEAFLRFLPDGAQDRALAPGMRAVDLGAAPGGWTWQLVHRHIHVIAVDNGPMAAELLESGLVEHRREDGFRFRPQRPVDWLVCDMVEQPRRIAELVAKWVSEAWCRYAIANLKLPMKKRYSEVVQCLDLIRDRLHSAGIVYHLECKQLFHDREEVTLYVQRS
jgi:23S rRNA (cytidine2498-2'-O)-methyltransferase